MSDRFEYEKRLYLKRNLLCISCFKTYILFYKRAASRLELTHQPQTYILTYKEYVLGMFFSVLSGCLCYNNMYTNNIREFKFSAGKKTLAMKQCASLGKQKHSFPK